MSQVLNHATAVVLLLCACSALVSAQSSVHYDFEDGRMHGDPTSMQVPPKVIGGVLRITGSAGDKDSIPGGFPPPWNRMNRSTVAMTSHFRSMPTVTDANDAQVYQADMRVHLPKAQGVNIFELFQNAPGGGGYNPDYGPNNLVRFKVGSVGRANGQLYFESRFDDGKHDDIDLYPLGPMGSGWRRLMIKAVWSHNPSEGRIEAYVDGRLRVTIKNRDSFHSPKATQLPMVKFGPYGIDGVGTVDVDNIRIGGADGGEGGPIQPPSAGPPSAPPPPPMVKPLPPPRNFRVVLH
jgi:Polysaccharide lyase